MRTRKHPYLLETIWLDKYKYDEAERLHHEERAMLLALEAERRGQVEAVNGVTSEELEENGLDGDPKKAGGRRKQKKRKRSPKTKTLLEAKVEAVLTGLQAEAVWFHKCLFEEAESAYQKKLADELAEIAAAADGGVPAENETQIENKANGTLVEPQNLTCNHGNLVACHHVLYEVWINKMSFDDAERAFVENARPSAAPRSLAIPATTKTSSWASGESLQPTPDEGYLTATPTPATPATPGFVGGAMFAPVTPTSTSLPVLHRPTVNGMPQFSNLQALVSEVWWDKLAYDAAERNFYEQMYGGAASAEEAEPLPESVQPAAAKSKTAEDGAAAPAPACSKDLPTVKPKEPSPAQCYLHEDSEPVWVKKSDFDNAERRFYVAQANKVAERIENPPYPGASRDRKPPAAAPPAKSTALPNNEMAMEFLLQERIWFEKYRYDDAERQYYERLNGPVASAQCSKSNLSPVCATAAAAPAPCPAAAGDSSELLVRISNLEQENKSLHKVVEDLRLAISKLETRLSTLETASASQRILLPAATRPAAPEVCQVEKDEGVADADDDDLDLFGSDEEEDAEAARVREERLRQYADKKSKKPALIAKSSILLDVKPWDDETDMAKLEECVRSVQTDGLLWGASKLVPVGYGIKKLQIQCVVEDDKVGTDMLEEEITKFEDYVQSVDVAAFNKI
ncbi:eukaryotic translation elongation factor 1 delta b (guanine nucleotide exchange protein) isoform X4 [Latimeria chalumnae]|uniref:eukaryotic translation elongation factor 1 delta b (guanine nucleotide exchange protein) isoform X4 n=1 Tax=Latimeria chalumnae TaxID=7897 RepID=UPI0003C1647E